MAVTKRTRYEVLRRDNYTCRYCGASAPDVVLQVDHVIPQALGGADDPSNLVASCRDCNAGKSSATPDQELVAQVNAQAVAMSKALQDAMRAQVGALDEDKKWNAHVQRRWNKVCREQRLSYAQMDANWKASLSRWRRMGVPLEVVDSAIDKALTKYGIRQCDRFAYMCGIVWNTVKDATNKAMGAVHDPAPQACGHCAACQLGHPEDCAIVGSPEDYECDICGRPGCLYHLGFEEGQIDQYMREHSDVGR